MIDLIFFDCDYDYDYDHEQEQEHEFAEAILISPLAKGNPVDKS
ncbi:MAG TPA: hypothetical protein VGW39_06995 [Chthoniobacterales bacterium]|nr:hypothetical protein [Chthoniobacterales bacterium]